MPRNPNGEYVLPSIYLAASGQTIRADQHNIPMQDIAQALTGSVARNGTTPMTGNLPMNGNRITGLAAATASSDAVRLDQVTKYSGYLNAVSGLALAANEITYATGPASAARTAITPFGRGLIAAADSAAGRTALDLGPLATATIVPVGNGGTGANNAGSARSNLGLGPLATVSVVPIGNGGTGATSAAAARNNIDAPWSPNGGDVRYGQTGNNTALVLPAGGRWEWSGQLVDIGNFAAPLQGGVASGGSTVAPAIGGTRSYMYRFWRVA